MLFELALEVCRFVLMDDVAGGHLVQVGLDGAQLLNGLLGILRSVQLLHHRPHLATGGAIADFTAFILSNALYG